MYVYGENVPNKDLKINTFNDAAKRLLSREITVHELRLMPYVQYLMVNEQKLEKLGYTVEVNGEFIKITWKSNDKELHD